MNKHDTIVSYVAGKIQKLGFTIKYMEGNHSNVVSFKPPIPQKIITHRPDVFGIKPKGAICIGEAKTISDLNTGRTKTQLLDFRKIVKENTENLLVIGIPNEAKETLLKLLYTLGIVIDKQIYILTIPEILLRSND